MGMHEMLAKVKLSSFKDRSINMHFGILGWLQVAGESPSLASLRNKALMSSNSSVSGVSENFSSRMGRLDAGTLGFGDVLADFVPALGMFVHQEIG
jgi:hypothetical protein